MSTIPILSAIAKYDDLMRCQRELTSSAAEESFFLFLQQYELTRLEYQKVIDEAKDLQRQLDDQTHQTIAFEKQLNHARKLLEDERKKRREAEHGKEQVEEKLVQLREVLLNDHTIKDETRKHLATLNNYGTHKKRKSLHQGDYGNEINSTGSFLSDLTQSEDDFLEGVSTNQKFKKHHPSVLNNTSLLNASVKKNRKSIETRRSTRQSLIEYGPNDKIVAQTKVSIPQDKRKPICAESIIEAIPSHKYQNLMPSIPSTITSLSSAEMQWNQKEQKVQKENKELYQKYEEYKNDAPDFKTPMKKKPLEQQTPSNKFYTPSAPSLDDLNHIKDFNVDIYATVKKKTRPHNFSEKTFLKPETCTVCQKRIRFGSSGFKCADCRACVHQDCRDKFTVTCVPQSASTPIVKSGQLGLVGDYTPNIAPMVPALIVHCVNEIETRGLHECGLYRVSGPDREVKALKDKFMRKGVPFLSNVDVHVLCGCIKDFLRSLREPLIPMALWTVFSNASQVTSDDEHAINREMHEAIRLLPQPNRDTLAYLIQHFQRIAECPEVKMPLTNFSKIFGPTIVGYSCADPDQNMMYAETQIQFAVMFALVSIPTDFWNRFVNVDGVPRLDDMNGFESYGSKFYSGTPSLRINRKERKFYATPPYPTSAKSKK